MRRCLLLVVGVCAFTWSLHAGQVVPDSATIVGQVVDAATGDPIGGAVVASTFAAVDDGTGGPSVPPTQRRVVASGNGRFVFTRVAPGPVMLSVTASGYLTGGFAQRRPGGPTRTLVVEEGQRTQPVTIRMWKPAVVEGRLVDEAGEPLVRVAVRALRQGWTNAKPIFSATSSATTDDRGVFRLTDLMPGDWVLVMPASYQTVPQSVRDEYRRQSGLGAPAAQAFTRAMSSSGAPSAIQPGDRLGQFVVQYPSGLEGLRPTEDGGVLGYAPTYFPPLGPDGLQVFRLEAGEHRIGIEMRAQPSRVVSVSGSVVGPEGPAGMVGVRLTPVALAAAFPDTVFEMARASTDSNGAFTFVGVAAGDYDVKVERIPRPDLSSMTTTITTSNGTMMTSLSSANMSPELPTEPTLTTTSRISVGNRDLAGLSLTLAAGPRVSGSVTFVGTGTPPTAEQLQRATVTLRSLDRPALTGITAARFDANGRFQTMGYPPGRYVVTAGSPGAGWVLHSVTLGGKDVSLEPLVLDSSDISGLVVTYSNRRTELSGAVIPAQGNDTDATLIAFPTDLRAWVRNGMNPRQLRMARSDSLGRYLLAGLPAGSYHVATLPPDADVALIPELFEGLATSATTVTLADGEKRVLDLRLGSSRNDDAPESDDVDRVSGPYVPDEAAGDQQAPARDAAAMSIGTGSISGVVTLDDDARTPVRRARVRLTGSAGTVTLVTATDDQGRFIFTELPPVRYSLVAERPGLINGTYGAARPGSPSAGAPLTIAEGQHLTGVSITMGRGAVITGRIVDEFGRPAEDATVTLMQYQTVNGQRTLRQAYVGTQTTDDRGVYRLFGLAAGEYLVGAAIRNIGSDLRRVTDAELQWAERASSTPPPADGPVVGSAPIYYPGTADTAAATLLRLNAGEELAGVDFAIGYVRTARVSGRVELLDGSVPRTVQLNFINDERLIGVGMSPFARVNPDGTFATASVPPGRYSLVARAAANPDPAGPPAPRPGGRGGAPAMSLWAMREIVLAGEDITGVVVTLAPGLKVSGRVTFDATTALPPADPRALSVRLSPVVNSGVSLGVPVAQLNADGTFVVDGVVPGSYRIAVGLPTRTGSLPTWTTRHIMLEGRDVADHGLVVKAGADISGVEAVLTDRVTEVSGTVTDPQGRPVTDYSVIILPADPTLWTVGIRRRPAPQRPDTTGRFRMIDLAAGDYYLAVVADLEPGQISDTAFLESLIPSAIKFTLQEGERKVQDVKLAGGEDSHEGAETGR